MKVLFRIDKTNQSNGEVVAVFVDQVFVSIRPNNRMCYTFAEQHTECGLDWVRENTRPAKPHEYASLLGTLTSIGYCNLVVGTLRKTLK
jgi:hypothetical protein